MFWTISKKEMNGWLDPKPIWTQVTWVIHEMIIHNLFCALWIGQSEVDDQNITSRYLDFIIPGEQWGQGMVRDEGIAPRNWSLSQEGIHKGTKQQPVISYGRWIKHRKSLSLHTISIHSYYFAEFLLVKGGKDPGTYFAHFNPFTSMSD